MRTRDLYFKYPDTDRYALKSVDLDFEERKLTVLMGENGSGKTTLLRLLAGLLEPTRGEVESYGKEVGFSPEDPELGFFARSVKKEVEFYPKNRGLKHEKMAESALEGLGISHLKDRLPYILSSGQQRLVSLASVLSGNPDIMVLDEPTHSLHRRAEQNIGELLRGINKTMVVSTHSSDFALNYADRLVVMHSSKVLARGSPFELLQDEEILEKAGIRMPGILRWSKERSLEEIPEDMDEALKIARERGEIG